MIKLAGNNTEFFKIENKRWILTSLFFGTLLLLPILIIFFKIFQDKGDSFKYLWENLLIEYSLNTLYLVLITSIFSIIIGVIPAWIISLYKFPGRTFYDIVLFLPLAIPSYIMAFTYSEILSFTGPIQRFIRKYFNEFYPFFKMDYLQIEVLGLILAFALSPYIYSVSRVSFSMIGSTYINISKNLGLSSFKIFHKIILPLSTPAIFSGLFLVIMEVLNEYGAVKYFGVNTYTAGIFRSWFSMGDIDSAIQLASILTIVVFVLIYVERIINSKSKFNYNSNTNTNYLVTLKNNKIIFAHIACIIPFFIGFLFPFVFILNNSLISLESTDFDHLFVLTSNTLLVCFIASVIVLSFATFFQYSEKITKSKINQVINKLISLGYAMPGAVVALGLIIIFTTVNKYFNSVYLIGSFFLLIYALVIRFLAVGKSPIKSSLEKHPQSFDDTAVNLGLGPMKIFQKIHFPINKSALAIAFILTFIDLMKELPITLILRPFNFDTLATQTYEFAVEEMLTKSSVYSLMIVIISSIMLLILRRFINKNTNVS